MNSSSRAKSVSLWRSAEGWELVAYDYRGTREWIFGLSRDSATIKERALLLALNEFAPNIEPSTARLADMLGTSEREVRRLLSSAKAKGLLTIELRTGQRSRYRLCVDPGGYVRPTPADMSPPEEVEPRTPCPPTPADTSSPPRTQCPPKQSIEAVNKADKISASQDAGTFALESPAPKLRATNGSSPRGKGRKRTERTAEDRAAYNRLRDVYFEVYEHCVGAKPPFGDREGGAIWKLYDAVGLERGESCLRNAFADEWGKVRSILTVAADPAKFMAAAPRKTNGRAAPQQADLDSVHAVMAAHAESFQ